jgi:hypothetical protein
MEAVTNRSIRCSTVVPGGTTMIVRRAFCLAAAAFSVLAGAGAAHAVNVSAGPDRLSVGTNSNLMDGDHFLLDVRVASVDGDGGAAPGNAGPVVGQNNGGAHDEEQYRDDEQFVFGPS